MKKSDRAEARSDFWELEKRISVILTLISDNAFEDCRFDQGADAAKREAAQKTDVTCIHAADHAEKCDEYNRGKNSLFDLDSYRRGQCRYDCADKIDQLIADCDLGEKGCVGYNCCFIISLIICVHVKSPF